MEDAITMMLVASITGAFVGVFLTTVANPVNNYFFFMAVFAIIGAGLANVVLLVLVKVYYWLMH